LFCELQDEVINDDGVAKSFDVFFFIWRLGLNWTVNWAVSKATIFERNKYDSESYRRLDVEFNINECLLGCRGVYACNRGSTTYDPYLL